MVRDLGSQLLPLPVSSAGHGRKKPLCARSHFRAGIHECIAFDRRFSTKSPGDTERQLNFYGGGYVHSTDQSIDRTRPLTFYVTDRKALPDASRMAILESICAAVSARVDFVQIREKDLPTRELLAITSEALRAANESGYTRIIVNDRLDVAVAAGAAGVHLGSESLSAERTVEWLRTEKFPADFLVGTSCHSLEEARQAETAGVHYAFFGPIFDTPSKRPFGAPQGTKALRSVCAAVGIPVIAIGGVEGSNAQACFRAGAAGIAAIRLFQGTRDATALALKVERIHRIVLGQRALSL